MKKFIAIIMGFVISCGIIWWAIDYMENYWCKNEVKNLWGNFDSLDIIDQTEHMTVYYAFRDGDAYVITVHNGELDKVMQIN